MKKIALSIFVIATFAFYVYHQKSEESEARVLPANVSNPVSELNQASPTAAPVASGVPPETPTAAPAKTGQFRDGTYTGDLTDAFYGPMQVELIVSGGKISDIKFLQYPNDRPTSIAINNQSNTILRQEAIESQSANVDIVSGATQSSEAFIQSLKSALNKAV